MITILRWVYNLLGMYLGLNLVAYAADMEWLMVVFAGVLLLWHAYNTVGLEQRIKLLQENKDEHHK